MRALKIFFTAVLSFILQLNIPSLAQTSPSFATAIAIDLEKHTIGDVPFDKPFYFSGSLPDVATIKQVKIELCSGRNLTSATLYKVASMTNATGFPGKTVVTLPVTSQNIKQIDPSLDFLLPNYEYTFRVTVTNTGDTLVQKYSFDWAFYPKTKIGDYTKLDFGIAYAPRIKAAIGVTNVHFYFTPTNDETDLAQIKNVTRNIFLRASLFLGISPVTFSSDTKQPIKNDLGVGNICFGIGIRAPFYWSFLQSNRKDRNNKVGHELLQPMRLIFGELLFKQADPHLLIAKDKRKFAPFVGISYDLNIASILGPIGKLISK